MTDGTEATGDALAAIEKLFARPCQADWFTDAFLEAVPLARMTGIVGALTTRHGALLGVAALGGGRFTVRLARAEVPALIALDPSGRIAGLRFEAAIPLGVGIAGLADAIAALPGTTAVLVTSAGTRRTAHNADMPLAVGSAAKLAILNALKDAYAAGRLAREQVVALDPAWRSLPTGILQDWAAGTPLTLAALETLMIAASDNTATDALIHLVGRDAVEAITPRNTPFATTAELFKLIAKQNGDAATAWQEGDAVARRTVLAGLARLPLPPVDALRAVPGVEWYMSATELAALLDDVAGQPAFVANPGLAARSDWQDIAYKGGSDIGVVSFVTRVTGKDGRTHRVVAIWNDAAASVELLAEPYRGLLRALAEGG